jgi:gamma-glutamyl phosphate reductase
MNQTPKPVNLPGPMGLDELTTYEWLGLGTGQIRT